MDALSYIGGFIDGEGCISAGYRQETRSYGLMFYVTQLDPAPLLLIQSELGGRLYRKPDHRGFRTKISWELSGQRAATALRTIRDYLVEKREQADVSIQLADRIANWSPANGLSKEEELAERRVLYEKLKSLKKQTYDHIILPEIPIKQSAHKGPRVRRTYAELGKKTKTELKPKKIRIKSDKVKGNWQRGRMPSREILEQDYLALGIRQTALKYSSSRQTVYNWLDHYAIPRTGRSPEAEARRIQALRNAWTVSE